jgi:chemotaxis protein methyltransferase CheR
MIPGVSSTGINSQGLADLRRAHGADREFALTIRDFTRVRHLIYEYSGIKLSEQKRSMVYNRLLRCLRASGKASFSDYLDWVQTINSPEREAFVNALTTNLTAFFREPHHFELLATRAAAHAKISAKPLRLWSSGCSTGEEAWSIAIVLKEVGCSAQILATDIDSEVLRTASEGVYKLSRLDQIGINRMQKHFLRGVGINEGLAIIRPELRSMVTFAQVNLQLQDWPIRGDFDVIFCRNVVIYFDKEFQQRLLTRFANMLSPGGLLVVGHSENFPAANASFRACGRTAYERCPV